VRQCLICGQRIGSGYDIARSRRNFAIRIALPYCMMVFIICGNGHKMTAEKVGLLMGGSDALKDVAQDAAQDTVQGASA